MAITANLGFPRIGIHRELKKALEGYWKGDISQQSLLNTASTIRSANWQLQKKAGIDHIPSNDFSFYDHILDATLMLNAIPSRFAGTNKTSDLDTYFQMARGSANASAMEMTKWFDTNYHYIVPEFEAGQTFSFGSTKIVDEFKEAKALGILTRPVLLGPITYLFLGKAKDGVSKNELIKKILPIYCEVLSQLASEGAEWVQIDEPVLSMDMSGEEVAMFQTAYNELLGNVHPKICITAYFGDISDKFHFLMKLPFDALHLDLVRAPQQLAPALETISKSMMLSLGIINGRNIWKANLADCLEKIRPAVNAIGKDRLIITPSCSLLHCPIDINCETSLRPEISEQMSFAVQKLNEIKIIRKAIQAGQNSIQKELDDNQAVFTRRKNSTLIHNATVQKRMTALDDAMFKRQSPHAVRKQIQQKRLNLPLLPTTTIGSFPQTPEIRKARADYNKGVLSEADYQAAMKREIEKVIRFQENAKLDVLVHGEPESNDMVEYFGQLLDGFAFTQNGWVQSYGSRCVKPPVIFGDVCRRGPMTIQWSQYAQSLTKKPVKGMLTGPITILQWSFVREDQPRKDTAWQIGLAIRDEVVDLETVGIGVIQIDEPALREGVPLRKKQWQEYFDWAVKAFRLSACGVQDETQIHTHMCYADFNDIMESIVALDADVISIEASRSDAALLEVFAKIKYPNDIGPGVYDIHSPRVPSVEQMQSLLKLMLKSLSKEQLWVNPDCGLKTRSWPETEQSLKNMVQAALNLRQDL